MRLRALLVSLLLLPTLAFGQNTKFDPARHSQTITECDRLAAHPDDPHHVGRGLERSEMDLPRAVAACRKDLAKDPDNPRIAYQLARALTYGGNAKEGLPLIERTAEQGYPQSLFVTGYLYLTGEYDAPKDPCRAGDLIRASAIAGRMAGQVSFPKYVLDGTFRGCSVKQERAEMIGFLEAAGQAKPSFYANLLIDELLRTLRGLPPGALP